MLHKCKTWGRWKNCMNYHFGHCETFDTQNQLSRTSRTTGTSVEWDASLCWTPCVSHSYFALLFALPCSLVVCSLFCLVGWFWFWLVGWLFSCVVLLVFWGLFSFIIFYFLWSLLLRKQWCNWSKRNTQIWSEICYDLCSSSVLLSSSLFHTQQALAR